MNQAYGHFAIVGRTNIVPKKYRSTNQEHKFNTVEDQSTHASLEKQRVEQKSKTASAEDNSWSMGNKRFVKHTEFKEKLYLGIREFYQNNGET